MDWQENSHQWVIFYCLPTKLRKSCLSVSHSTLSIRRGCHVAITHGALDLTIQGSSWPCPPDMGPYCTGTLPPCSNLFIMKRVRLACGQFASYWNASLYLNFTRNIFWTVYLTILKRVEWIAMVMFTHDITKCKNSPIRGWGGLSKMFKKSQNVHNWIISIRSRFIWF